MEQYIDILHQSPLFKEIHKDELKSMLTCLGAYKQEYKKGSYVLKQGSNLNHIPILVKGTLHIQKNDYWGNLTIINIIETGDIFGEAYVTRGSGPILNDVVAIEDSTIIYFDIHKILTTCASVCTFHTHIIKNLFFVISEKNKSLVHKLEHISKRTTREKLISYLSYEAKKNGTNTFLIPFNRQQLADFLSVDRSAMSNELCKMRDANLIEFHKNRFTLL